jgi:hypothetical protein
MRRGCEDYAKEDVFEYEITALGNLRTRRGSSSGRRVYVSMKRDMG